MPPTTYVGVLPLPRGSFFAIEFLVEVMETWRSFQLFRRPLIDIFGILYHKDLIEVADLVTPDNITVAPVNAGLLQLYLIDATSDRIFGRSSYLFPGMDNRDVDHNYLFIGPPDCLELYYDLLIAADARARIPSFRFLYEMRRLVDGELTIRNSTNNEVYSSTICTPEDMAVPSLQQ